MMNDAVEVRMFGLLHADCTERGAPTLLSVQVPAEGIAARDLARLVDAPLDLIEGVFCNGTVYGPGHLIMPGDRVAFVPKGTPGPHRVFLRPVSPGREEWDEEPEAE